MITRNSIRNKESDVKEEKGQHNTNINVYSIMINACEYVIQCTKKYIIDTNLWIYLLWVCLHYASAHLYVYYCTPIGIFGFIYSIFISPTPLCYALSWSIYNGNLSLFNIWSILGALCVGRLSFTNVKINNNNNINSQANE